MGKRAARTMGLEVNSTDLACYVDNFTQNVTPEAPAVTTFCDDGPRRVPGNYDWNHAISGTADFAPGAVDPTLYGLVGSRGAPSMYEATGGPARPTAPVYGGDVVLGSYQIQHRVGQAATYSGQLLGTSALTRDVGSSLLVGLESYWTCDEDDGSLIDVHGSNHLAAINAPTSAAGRVGTARHCTAASTQHFSIASNSSLQIPATSDFAFACWAYFDDLSSRQTLFAKGSEYEFELYDGNQYVWGWVGIGFGTTGFVTPVAGAWQFLMAWRDSTGMHIQANNGAIYTAVGAVNAAPGAQAFTIGACLPIPGNLNGRIDEVALWKGTIPSAAQRAAMWNGGAGVTYPFVGIP